MVNLSVGERELIYKFLDMSGGYVLLEFYRLTGKNKTWTQKLIYDATGIDIYKDESYKGLSQQKAIEKIIDERTSNEVAKLLRNYYDYISLNEEDYIKAHKWCNIIVFAEIGDKIVKLIEKLENVKNSTLELPKLDIGGLSNLEKDLRTKINNNEYDLALDRLHTYSLFFLKKLCEEQNITPKTDPKGHIMFDDMVTQLANKYNQKQQLNEFDNEVIKSSKSIFQKYNQIRNNKSYAHPNSILENARAEYVVTTVITLLVFFNNINLSLGNSKNDYDELPF